MSSDTISRETGRRRSRFGMRARVVSALALLAVIGLALLSVGPVLSWLSPMHEQTTQSATPPLLLQVRSLAQYRAATGTFQTLAEIDHSTTNVPSFLSGERTTLFAVGTVDALVDFSDLGPDRVVLAPDGHSATISLPAPTVGPAVIDPAQSRIVGHQRGIVQRVGDAIGDEPADDRPLYDLAAQKLTAAAQGSDLVPRAEESTRTMLTSLAGSLGVARVTVTFEPAHVQ
jgi:hypothetical protein